MISYKKKPNTPEDIDRILCEPVKKWFHNTFPSYSLPQLYGVMEIHSRRNVLLSAPTGSTKTLTAFLSVLNELTGLSINGILEDKVYAVYVSPLKALNEDIKVNLLEPLKGIEKEHGKKLGIGIATRTGDTSASERQKMLRKPPHILITTPESLGIMMTTKKFIESLKSVQYLIMDEIHSLAENKRGTHASLTFEKLQYYNNGVSRIGLSATISPIERVAEFMTGYDNGHERDIMIIDVSFTKKLDLKTITPVNDMISSKPAIIQERLYRTMHEMILSHKTTLIFTNTRSATERVVNTLKEKYPLEYGAIGEKGTVRIGAHHSSLSKTVRHGIEKSLREGKLRAVVCSTSLELGIDIGTIDLVILLGSPKSVSRALQRIGRAGHKLHETSIGRLLAMDRDDLIECSIISKCAFERKIDNIHIPLGSLDVLAQQVYGFCITQPWDIEELYSLIRKAYPYKDLSREDYLSIIEYLKGNFPILEKRNVYAKIWYDNTTNMIGSRGKNARIIFMTNIGTIPDESHVSVKIKGSDNIVGKIDEIFLERLRKGDVFVLGGEKYMFLHAQGMVAFVQGSIDRPPTIPSWHSEMLPLSHDTALEIGRLRKKIRELYESNTNTDYIIEWIMEYIHCNQNTATAIHNYLREQYDFMQIPHHEHIIVERYKDQGYTYLLFNAIYGRRVNDVLSRAIAFIAGKIHGRDVQVGITDSGFYIMTRQEFNTNKIISYLRAEKLGLLMEHAIENSEVLGRRFRHCAARSLMILRNYKGRSKTAGRQQVSSMKLLKTVKGISEDFPILKEARREVLEDMMDIGNAMKIIEGIESKRIMVEERNIGIPSPFSFNILLQGRSDLIRIEDRHDFIKRMHNQVMAKIELDKARGIRAS